MGKIEYDSRNSNGGTTRPFEFTIETFEDGSLTINYYKSEEIKSKISSWYRDETSITAQYTNNIDCGNNWNLNWCVCAVGYLSITMYDQSSSQYPKECFLKSGIDRKYFVTRIIKSFNKLRGIIPEFLGPEDIVVSKSTPSPKTTKQGEETMKSLNIGEITKEIVSDNAEFAKFEAERKIGQTALNLAVGQFVKQFPSAEPFANTPIGKLVIANTFRVAGNMYSGNNKEHVDMITSAIMRGSYATCGDSINLDAILDGFVDRFKNLIPGLGFDTKASESSADAK